MTDDAVPPQAAVMQMVMGAWISQTISTVTRLDLPDIIHKHGPLSASEIVARHGIRANVRFLERVLRACASLGIFSEAADGRFGATPLTEPLTRGSPVSVKKLVEIMGASWWKVWGGLENAIHSGESQAKAQLGLPYWDYCKANPKEMEAFGEAMKSNSHNSMRGVLEQCDFSRAATVVDVGGGLGHLAVALLRKYPELRATVLDVPDLMPLARERAAEEAADVLARLTFVGGDMFAQVPPADAYVIKHIIHDWDDERCVKLLQNCARALNKDGRVHCVDSVLPPMGNTTGTAAKLLDLDMMVFVPGKERTEAQWRSLFGNSGFKLQSMTPIHDNFGTSILTGVKLA